MYVCAHVCDGSLTLRAHKDGLDRNKPSVSISCEPNAEMR